MEAIKDAGNVIWWASDAYQARFAEVPSPICMADLYPKGFADWAHAEDLVALEAGLSLALTPSEWGPIKTMRRRRDDGRIHLLVAEAEEAFAALVRIHWLDLPRDLALELSAILGRGTGEGIARVRPGANPRALAELVARGVLEASGGEVFAPWLPRLLLADSRQAPETPTERFRLDLLARAVERVEGKVEHVAARLDRTPQAELDSAGSLEGMTDRVERWKVSARAPKGRDGHNWQLWYRPPPGKGRPGKPGRPYQRSAGTADADEARRIAAAEEARLNGETMPLPEVLSRYLEWRELRRASARTLDTYRSRAKRLTRLFGGGPVDRPGVLQLQDALARESSARTVNQHIYLAKAAWEWALERELVSEPWPTVSRLEETQTDLRPCTAEEAHRILAALREVQGGRYYALVCLMHDAGSRVTETCSLREADLDRERAEVRFTKAKGGRSRTAVASREVLELIPRRAPEEWCFPRGDGQPIHRHQVYHAFMAALELAGLAGERLTPHSLRRSWITDSLREGVGLGQSMLQTGHTTASVHLGYRRNAPDEAQRSAHERVTSSRPPLPHLTPINGRGSELQSLIQQGEHAPTRFGCSGDSDPTPAEGGTYQPPSPPSETPASLISALLRLADLGEEERAALLALARTPELQLWIGRTLESHAPQNPPTD